MLRFPPPKVITLKEDKTKVYILLQTAVARIFIPEFSLRVEQSEVVECGLRLLSALSEVCIERLRGALLENCLLLERALRQRLWEQGYTTVFTQCPELSEGIRKALVEKHIVELQDLVPYNKNAVDVQNHLKCSYQEATALHAFTTICLAHQVTVSFQLIDTELQLQVQPSAHYKPEYQHIQNCPKYHLVCYDEPSGQLLCHRFTQCSATTQTIAVPLPASVPYERVRCVAISSVVGLDVVIPSIAARLNPSHPSASNGSSAAGMKAPKKTSSSTQQQITVSMTPKRPKATKASEGSAHVVSPLKPPLSNPTPSAPSVSFEQFNYDPTPHSDNQAPVPRESPDQGKAVPHQKLITDYEHMYNNTVNYDSIAPHVQAQTQPTNITSSTATNAYVPNSQTAPAPAPVVKEISPYLPSNYKLANYNTATAAVPTESSKYIPLSEVSGSKWHRGDSRKDMTSVDSSVPYELRIVRQKGSELNAPVSFTNPAKRLRQNFASPSNNTLAAPVERVHTSSRMIPPPPLTSLQAFATQAMPFSSTNTHPQSQMQGSNYESYMMPPPYSNQNQLYQHRPEVALMDTPPSSLVPFDFLRDENQKYSTGYFGESAYPYDNTYRHPHTSSSSLHQPEPTYLEPVFSSEQHRGHPQQREPAHTYNRWSERRNEDSAWPAALPPRMQSPPLARPPLKRSNAPFFDSEPLLPSSSYSKPVSQSALWPIPTARDRLQSPRPRMSDPFDLASPPTDPLTRLSQILPRSATTAMPGSRDTDNRSHLLALPIGGRHTLASDRGASEHPMVSVSRAPASNIGRNMP